MPDVKLNGPAVIDGAVRYPVEGPIFVSDDEAERLLENGNLDEEAPFSDDDLEKLKVEGLKQIAAEEQVDLTGITKKPDIIAAIRAKRAPAPQE
jgi:hypothetical protein